MSDQIWYLLWVFDPSPDSLSIITNIARAFEGTVTEVDDGENIFISFPTKVCREVALEDMLQTYSFKWICEDLPTSEMKRYRG